MLLGVLGTQWRTKTNFYPYDIKEHQKKKTDVLHPHRETQRLVALFMDHMDLTFIFILYAFKYICIQIASR